MISIVLTHYNRTKLLERTLNSFKHYYDKYVEVIVVDDGSSTIELERLYDLRRRFNFRLISIAAKDKWYSNPCIPFNIGIDQAVGEKCILQSAECIHLGSVIKTVDEHFHSGDFMSFACYSLDTVQTKALDSMNFVTKDVNLELLDIINPPNNNPITHCEESGWYNHSTYRPLGFHWCNAYNTNELRYKIGGFDERFATGVAYDDDEFVHRSKRDLKLRHIDTTLVLHQWHGLENYYKQKNPVIDQVKQDFNRVMFEHVTLKEQDNKNIINHLHRTVKYVEL